jgi:predicted transposase YbfD/YdcC
LQLANGLPSHDTFSRLFRNLDPEQFRASFQRFMAEFSVQCAGVVAIDGKVVRRWFDRASGKSALHMVSAWGSEQRLVLGQIATDAKSNEITAVPKLLRLLTLKGTIVTTDALNCQRAIAAQIVEQEGDYALALKENQPSLYEDVVLLLNDLEAGQSTMLPVVEADHGRIETRTATVSTEVARQHWGVENSLHSRLDVVMNEDQDRTRMGYGLENLAVLRHMAINAMQKEGSKGSLQGKFKRAGWDDDFLYRLLEMF